MAIELLTPFRFKVELVVKSRRKANKLGLGGILTLFTMPNLVVADHNDNS